MDLDLKIDLYEWIPRMREMKRSDIHTVDRGLALHDKGLPRVARDFEARYEMTHSAHTSRPAHSVLKYHREGAHQYAVCCCPEQSRLE